MNRWNSIAPWLTACAVALVFSLGTIDVASAAEGDDQDAALIKPYEGPPIFLDQPESPPPASLVEKRVDSEKYPDGKVRFEREIARYSDNHFVADGFYREFYPNGQKFAEGQYKNGQQVGAWTGAQWHLLQPFKGERKRELIHEGKSGEARRCLRCVRRDLMREDEVPTIALKRD